MAKKPSAAARQRMAQKTVVSRILEETNQGHTTRAGLYRKVEDEIGPGHRVLSFFTSFFWPVVVSDSDADMVEEVLRTTLASTGDKLVLILNSPGGDPLAAERIVHICRSYSKDSEYIVIVPKMAKSAATMISLGATEIWMSKTSELGPIDPQIPVKLEGEKRSRYVAAHEIVNSYNELMDKANKTTGQMAPYLQQLQRYDARAVQRIISAQQLSEVIAVETLKTGIMKGQTDAQIRQKISVFLDPVVTKVHGRPVYHDVAKKCGLDIKVQDSHSSLWEAVWELYMRLDSLVRRHTSCKVVESANDLYTAPVPSAVLASMGHDDE